MSDIILVGTDTGAGKTTVALLWMAACGEHYDYWKPVESGDSDTKLVERLVPSARVHPPMARYRDAVAPAWQLAEWEPAPLQWRKSSQRGRANTRQVALCSLRRLVVRCRHSMMMSCKCG
jgi:dethiobiotin synthetase